MHSETFRGTKKAAERRLRELQTQLDHGIDIAPEKVTVEDHLRRWFERHQAGRLAPRTARRYQQIIESRLVPDLGGVRLKDLRADHLEGLYARQSASLSQSSVRQHHVVLNMALKDAVRTGLLARNPADIAKPPRLARPRERRALSNGEIRQLLGAARGTRFAAVVRFALATGLREGELLALRWDDAQFDQRTVTVHRTAIEVTGLGVQFSPTKTATSRRTVELSATTTGLLREHRQHQVEERLRLGPAWEEHGLVFPSSVGTPWSPRNFYRDYKRVVANAALPDSHEVTFHCLRHTAATLWIRAGTDIHVVSRRLGHTDPAFTMRVYGHLLHGMQKTAASALDPLIG